MALASCCTCFRNSSEISGEFFNARETDTFVIPRYSAISDMELKTGSDSCMVQPFFFIFLYIILEWGNNVNRKTKKLYFFNFTFEK